MKTETENLIELDSWIAEHVMGWRLTNYEDGRDAKTPSDYADAAKNDGWTWNNGTDEEAWQFQPSKKAAYAMDVLEKCAEKCTVTVEKSERFEKPFMVARLNHEGGEYCEDFCKCEKTLPLAICKFAKAIYSK